jgi:hypothetical protein
MATMAKKCSFSAYVIKKSMKISLRVKFKARDTVYPHDMAHLLMYNMYDGSTLLLCTWKLRNFVDQGVLHTLLECVELKLACFSVCITMLQFSQRRGLAPS